MIVRPPYESCSPSAKGGLRLFVITSITMLIIMIIIPIMIIISIITKIEHGRTSKLPPSTQGGLRLEHGDPLITSLDVAI